MTDKIRDYFVVQVVDVPRGCRKYLWHEYVVYSGTGTRKDTWFCKDKVNGHRGTTIQKKYCKVMRKYNWPKKSRGVRQVRIL